MKIWGQKYGKALEIMNLIQTYHQGANDGEPLECKIIT